MNVSLTPKMENWIQEKVQTGFYSSASEVVRDALRIMHSYELERDLDVQLLRLEVMRGIDALDRGDSRELNREVLEEIKARARARHAEQQSG